VSAFCTKVSLRCIETMPRLTLIAAVSADGFISRNRGVPWDLPADRAHFRANTKGRWLLLGRRTYEEMLGWFQPGHHPLVLSRDAVFRVDPGQKVASVDQALALAEQAGQEEVMVCGGGQIYAAALPRATKLILTHVDHRLGQGIPFPTISPQQWQEIAHQEHPADAEHAHAFRISTYQRISSL
jgi:dihydrofolate reductase